MKRSTWHVVLLIMVLALVAAACGGTDDTTTTTAAPTTTAAAAETTTTEAEATETTEAEAMDWGEPTAITLGHPFPEQHPIHQGAWLPWSEEIAETTGGVITIEFHPGQALAAAPATFENTVIGGQDLGWALQGYHAGLFQATEVVEQPFQFTSAEQATRTLWDLYDEYPELRDEYSDVKLLGLWTHDIGDFWLGEKEVLVLEDFAGLNLRFPTRMMGNFITEAGASAVGMPAPQIFDSLSTGVIDGLSIAISGLQSFQLYDELTYGAECNCYVGAQYLVMNMDTWDGLTPDTQKLLMDTAREYSYTAGEVYDGAYERVKVLAAEAGIITNVIAGDELDRWHEVGATVTANWIAEQEEQGVPAQEMFDRMQEIKADYE